MYATGSGAGGYVRSREAVACWERGAEGSKMDERLARCVKRVIFASQRKNG